MKQLLLLLSFFVLQQMSAQKIRLKVEDQKDTTVFLIKYFGSKLFYADTAQMKNGEVIFDGAKQKPGIVGLFLPGQRYFEFVYNNEEIQLDEADRQDNDIFGARELSTLSLARGVCDSEGQ